jgi:uncharacterized membrane protein (UPF0127 family)
MKKIIFIFLITAGVIFFLLRWKVLLSNKKNTISYVLNNRKYELLTAATPQEWEKGLMFYRKLDGADGMMFIFPDKKVRNFWNKNTFMDLRLYWLDGDTVIGESFLPSVEKNKETVIVSSPGKANKVIELPL